ncbi:MAG: LysR substrate-binding domain-containing protein [Oceanicaulis sp.]
MRPTLRQLEYFVAVAERQAFGPAADALAVTQPSLSKQIAALEAELGLALFERTSRKVRLTSAGTALLPQAQAVLDTARGFKAAARKLAGDRARRLTAGVLPSIGAYFMPRFRERLSRSQPDLAISLVEGPSSDLLVRLQSGELDFVVASVSEEGGFDPVPLFEETLWICSAPGDPLMEAEGPAPLEALAGRTLLTLSPEFHLTRIVERLAARAGAHLSQDYRGASLDAVRQMAASGAGVAVLPSLYALGEAIRDPAFKVRRIVDRDAFHPVRLYWRRSSPDAALFERLAEEMIAEKMQIRSERAARFQV